MNRVRWMWLLLLPGMLLGGHLTRGEETGAGFRSGVPVWPAGREREKNLTVGFRSSFTAPKQGSVRLRVAASTVYRTFLNGVFVGHGPARAGHGYYRVDDWDLRSWLVPGTNVVAIEVVGYNVNSYALLDQPSFLQAEVGTEDGVVAATTDRPAAPGAFEARVVGERVQKTQRYSFQRPFSEVWRLTSGWDVWRRTVRGEAVPLALAVQGSKSLLPRRVPLPDFRLRPPIAWRGFGNMKRGPTPARPWKDRSLTGVGPKLGGFAESDLATIPSLEFQAWTNASVAADFPSQRGVPPPGPLRNGDYAILDYGVNLTGFFGVAVEARTRARMVIAFDEILTRGDVDWKRLGCVNLVSLELEPGRYEFETFEPYTARYWKIVAMEGEMALSRTWVRELCHPDVDRASFASSDPRLNRLFEAGRETYRQNAVDIFMDCPSRERAGWLCDSFFTARVAPWLNGDTRVEKNFLENFLLPSSFAHLPEGVLPMCYPADHDDGVFIPNWALWFVVELEEYAARSGDRAMVEAARPRVARLVELLHRLRNERGLLEKLPSWVFLEWSKANDWVQDVNFPSNMLYARVLEIAGRLYQVPEWTEEAARLKQTIRQLSYDGRYFVDNAVRRDGQLVVTTNRSEVCQYFAFFFDVATPESHPELWKTLREDFGPKRKQTGAHPEIAAANAFVGNVLRLELLSRHGYRQQTLDESVGYLLYMADRTGTLWENDGDYASCNHGFASHIVNVLYRDVLGLVSVDPVDRRIQVRLAGVDLEWCEGAVPLPEGRASLRWWRENGELRYHLESPEGYGVRIEVPPGLKCREVP